MSIHTRSIYLAIAGDNVSIRHRYINIVDKLFKATLDESQEFYLTRHSKRALAQISIEAYEARTGTVLEVRNYYIGVDSRMPGKALERRLEALCLEVITDAMFVETYNAALLIPQPKGA